MSSPKQPDTEELVNKARQGDSLASQQLLTRHRGRLRKMVAVRMSDRLQARIDPSDVVQEALTIAAQRLPDYLRQPSLPFYPWLRNLAWQRLVDCGGWDPGSADERRANRYHLWRIGHGVSGVTLTASNILKSDPTSTILDVTFSYVDNNGNTVVLSATQTSPGVWTYTAPSGLDLTSGTYTVTAVATDSNGVLSDPLSVSLTVTL